MKNYQIINQAKFFTVGLEQNRTGNRLIPFMQGNVPIFLDALGEIEKPKIKTVFLSASASLLRIGLYTLDQGRRPGRAREVPGTRKIGGLVVKESVAPAHGLFECCLDLETELAPLPDFSTPIRQIIRTDGKTWRVLVRGADADLFTIAEEFTLPTFSRGLEWAMPKQGGALFDVQQELYGFIEFLRRAMIPMGEEETLAKTIASFGRELLYWLMASDDTQRLERFVHEFCPKHNLHIGTLTPELQAAKILTYCMVIDAAMAGISPQNFQPSATDALSPQNDWFALAQCEHHAMPIGILRTITDKIRDSKDFLLVAAKFSTNFQVEWGINGRSITFCSALWRELGGNENGIESFWGAIGASDSQWSKDVLAAAQGEWQRENSGVLIVNIGAGAGNCAVEVATTVAKTASSVVLSAGDPDPIASQTIHFRLLIWRLFLALGGHNLAYHCAFGAPFILIPIPPSTRPMLVFCDCLLRYPSGAKAIGDEFSRRFELALEFIGKYRHGIVSLRVPADFLDGKQYLDLRRKLFASNRKVWVCYDETQERPKDKRLVKAVATIILSAVDGGVITPPEDYQKLEAKPELQYSLMPPRLSGGYLSWPALTDLAAVSPLNGPIERRGMTLIDTDADALALRVRDYLSPDVSDERIAEKYPLMMKNAGRFNAALSRRKLVEKTTFNPAHTIPYPFRPFDERFAYLREMRPLFSDPAPDLQVIASIPGNWFLLASEGDAGIGVGVAAWSSAQPCDYDYFAGRSRHFPVWIPEAILDGLPIRTSHGGWEQPEDLRPRANLSQEAKRLFERLGYSNPDENADSASILWNFALAVLYTPAYVKENQTALRLGWPRLPLPGWGKEKLPPPESRELIAEYAACGAKIRGILSGAELEHKDILSNMATVCLYSDHNPIAPSRLGDAERTLSTDWGVPAKGNAVRARGGALAPKHTEGALLKRIFELADAMKLPHADCLERLGQGCADARINDEAYWTDIPGAAWDFTIGGRKVLRKWLSYRDYRVINRPMTPMEMEQFSNIARRLVVLTLVGIKLDKLWPELLNACKE